MLSKAQLRYQMNKLKNYLAVKTEIVNHQAIIRDVSCGVERSWIYYLMLLMAALIALFGLLTNSVAGYGLGTGQLMLGMGGLLFFTNFVAIVLTSDLVFFVMGFRTSHVESIQYSPRKRILIIAGLLILISIPLVYTLVVDLQKMKTTKRIESVLKKISTR